MGERLNTLQASQDAIQQESMRYRMVHSREMI